MKTAQKTEAEFREDLRQLLEKYNAEMELEDVGRDWSHDHVITVTIPAVYNDDHERERDFATFRLGNWLNGDDA